MRFSSEENLLITLVNSKTKNNFVNQVYKI